MLSSSVVGGDCYLDRQIHSVCFGWPVRGPRGHSKPPASQVVHRMVVSQILIWRWHASIIHREHEADNI